MMVFFSRWRWQLLLSVCLSVFLNFARFLKRDVFTTLFSQAGLRSRRARPDQIFQRVSKGNVEIFCQDFRGQLLLHALSRVVLIQGPFLSHGKTFFVLCIILRLCQKSRRDTPGHKESLKKKKERARSSCLLCLNI